MTTEITERMVDVLSSIPIASTRHLTREEEKSGAVQMLCDLKSLANDDGCIAAAWALEVLEAIAQGKTPQTLWGFGGGGSGGRWDEKLEKRVPLD